MSFRIELRTALLAASIAIIGIPGAEPVYAGVNCDDAAIVDKLPKLPNGCQRERISAAGNQRPSFFWARKSVEDHWQDQVINKFGERFADPAYAACAKQECGPSTIAGFTRCTFSGFPCATKPYIEDLLELSTNEIAEMQRLLNKHGPNVVVDGKFGSKTHDALMQWQQKNGLEADGLPTKVNLERLRKA